MEYNWIILFRTCFDPWPTPRLEKKRQRTMLVNLSKLNETIGAGHVDKLQPQHSVGQHMQVWWDWGPLSDLMYLFCSTFGTHPVHYRSSIIGVSPHGKATTPQLPSEVTSFGDQSLEPWNCNPDDVCHECCELNSQVPGHDAAMKQPNETDKLHLSPTSVSGTMGSCPTPCSAVVSLAWSTHWTAINPTLVKYAVCQF